MPFLEFPVELRKFVYTTNAIESLNARCRRACVTAGTSPPNRPRSRSSTSWPRSARPNRQNLVGKINGWKHILNALSVHHGDRIAAIR